MLVVTVAALLIGARVALLPQVGRLVQPRPKPQLQPLYRFTGCGATTSTAIVPSSWVSSGNVTITPLPIWRTTDA